MTTDQHFCKKKPPEHPLKFIQACLKPMLRSFVSVIGTWIALEWQCTKLAPTPQPHEQNLWWNVMVENWEKWSGPGFRNVEIATPAPPRSMTSSLSHKLKPVKQGSFFCAPACLYNLLVHCLLPDDNAVFSRHSSTYAPTTRFLLVCSAPPVSFLRHMVIICVFNGLDRVNRINVTICRKTKFTEL